MCAEVDAHKKGLTFIRRSRQFFNESQRTDQKFFFCVLVVRDGLYPAAGKVNTRYK